MVLLVLAFSRSLMYFDSKSLYHYYILNVISLSFIFQNTVEGRIAYFPVVGRLDCSSSSAEHRGFWELAGFGLLGVYKSDWTKIGGKWNSVFLRKWSEEQPNDLDAGQNLNCNITTMQSLFNRLTRYDKHVFLLIKFLTTVKHFVRGLKKLIDWLNDWLITLFIHGKNSFSTI